MGGSNWRFGENELREMKEKVKSIFPFREDNCSGTALGKFYPYHKSTSLWWTILSTICVDPLEAIAFAWILLKAQGTKLMSRRMLTGLLGKQGVVCSVIDD